MEDYTDGRSWLKCSSPLLLSFRLITIFLPEQKVVFLLGVLCLLQSLLVASIFFITGFYWFLLGWGFYWVVDNLWLSRSWKIELLKLQNNDTIFLFLDHSHQVLRDCFCFFFSWCIYQLGKRGLGSRRQCIWRCCYIS